MLTVQKMDYSNRGCLIFMLHCAKLLGEQDQGRFENQDVLRLLTPILKLFTAKECLNVISEGLECFGAMGYMEDSHIPRIYRDA